MRKFVSFVILSLLLSFLSILILSIFILPLTTFAFYGALNLKFTEVLSNMLNKLPSEFGLIFFIVQFALSLLFFVILFVFFKKIIKILLPNDESVRNEYCVIFALSNFLPVVLMFLSIFLKKNLFIVSFLLLILFYAFISVITILLTKVLPKISKKENREYLFSEDEKND